MRPGPICRRFELASFQRGDIIVLPFPFSNATGSKRRPALVLAELPYFGGMDYLVCMITSQNSRDPHSIEIQPADLSLGQLAVQSSIRPLYLFAAESNTIVARIGRLKSAKISSVIKIITSVIND